MRSGKKVIISCLVILAALFYLAFSGFRDAKVHVSLEALVQAPKQYQGQVVQTEGRVIGDSIHWDAPNVELTFQVTGLKDPGSHLPVVYRNVRPENFQDATEVMISGTFTAGEDFAAEELITKCPSKYEAKTQ